MIKSYKLEAKLDAPSKNCNLYKVSKDGIYYLMH